MRAMSTSLPVPEFPDPSFSRLTTPLAQARVAIVTSAAIHPIDADRFTAADTSFRTIERSERRLVLGHWSPNFDHTGFALDLNVVFPIDRLEELRSRGEIGDVAPRHFSFAGNQPDDVAAIRLDSGPRVAQHLLDDDVDVVVLTPV